MLTGRQEDDGPQARRIVFQSHRAAVQAGDGGDQAEAEAGAGAGAALLQANETLQRALAVLRRDSRAAVGNGDGGHVAARFKRDLDG